MSDAKRYEITPEQAARLKAKVADCLWETTGERQHTEVTVQGVQLGLSYTPPILDVTVFDKPWYATLKTVWEKLDEYIYQNLNV